MHKEFSLMFMKKSFWKLTLLCVLSLGLFSQCSKKNIPSVSKTKEPQTKSSNLSKQDKVVAKAKTYIGTKYKYGGTTSSGMDCSGLMCQSYASVNIKLPRTSNDQSNYGKRVYIGELQKGDMIFFGAYKGSKKVTHVGMISSVSKSQIKFIHASSSKGVMESELSTYWRDRYIKARRPI